MSDKVITKLNVNLPVDVAMQLEVLVDELKCNKRDVVTQALRQYIAIKNRELYYRMEHPNAKITSEVKLRSHDKNEARDFASVLLF